MPLKIICKIFVRRGISKLTVNPSGKRSYNRLHGIVLGQTEIDRVDFFKKCWQERCFYVVIYAQHVVITVVRFRKAIMRVVICINE